MGATHKFVHLSKFFGLLCAEIQSRVKHGEFGPVANISLELYISRVVANKNLTYQHPVVKTVLTGETHGGLELKAI